MGMEGCHLCNSQGSRNSKKEKPCWLLIRGHALEENHTDKQTAINWCLGFFGTVGLMVKFMFGGPNLNDQDHKDVRSVNCHVY